ncbi:MAG TPA: sigma-70 family RNA polymerase sigma factor [Pirellulales bacterium]|jgi:RNA polymerase sigma factor (sigma-70 family)|nr:sigma-70 family RNA polymerase sigma factor [Pirellulales bacterium]
MTDLSDVVAEHSAAVWRTAYRLLNDREDTLDCHQETFLAAQKLADQGSVQCWRSVLVQIATRRAIDRLRQRYRRSQERGESEPILQADADISPEAHARAAELREHVRRALSQLPEQQAEAFWLRHVEDLDVSEVAAQMSLEPGHVRVLVHRAAVALRLLLGPGYGANSRSEEQT